MGALATLLPADLSPWAAIIVIATSFFASAVTAAFSIGGGLTLIAVMSALFPPAAVVPVHGVAQLSSNLSRASLQYKKIIWPIVGWFCVGAGVGVAVGGQLAVSLPAFVLRFGVAGFILFSVWGPKLKGFAPGNKTTMATGAVSTFLTMFFGATGPIVATMLSAFHLDRLSRVATHGAMMVVQHGLKIAVFGILGFAYREWIFVILLIIGSGILGTLLGTRLLHKMSEEIFAAGFKWLLSLIAVYLIIAGFIELRTN